MNLLVARLFVVVSLIWMTASVIDIAHTSSSLVAKVEYSALAMLGVTVIFLIALCTQWIIDSVEDTRELEH